MEDLICKHCNGAIAERNPKGYCDHLYYPENCVVCRRVEAMGKQDERSGLLSELSELLNDEDLTDEKLRDASEDLLPRIHDYLLEPHDKED